MEGPVAFGDGLHLFQQLGLEGLFPGALVPDAPDGPFGMGNLLVATCFSNLPNHLCHDVAAGGSAPRLYANPVQDRNGELNIDVAHEPGRCDGAVGRDRLPVGRPPARLRRCLLRHDAVRLLGVVVLGFLAFAGLIELVDSGVGDRVEGDVGAFTRLCAGLRGRE